MTPVWVVEILATHHDESSSQASDFDVVLQNISPTSWPLVVEHALGMHMSDGFIAKMCHHAIQNLDCLPSLISAALSSQNPSSQDVVFAMVPDPIKKYMLTSSALVDTPSVLAWKSKALLETTTTQSTPSPPSVSKRM